MTVSRDLHRLAIDIGEVPRRSMITAAKAVKEIATQEARRATGGGVIALGRNRKPTRLRAVDKISDHGTFVFCRVQGVPVGAWVWINTGTGAHVIPKARRGKARTTRYLKGDRYEHPIGRPVHHPGASGKGAWRKVRKRAEVVVPDIFRDTVREVIR
jgi:hypothetical protein